MLTRKDLELEAAALLELTERKKTCPLYYMTPNPKFEPFLDFTGPVAMASGGNRSGKTHHLVAKACAASIGYKPWVLRKLGAALPNDWWRRPESLPHEAIFFDRGGLRISSPSNVMVISGLPQKRGVGETLWPKFRDLLGPAIERPLGTRDDVPTGLLLKNGSKILFASAAQQGLAFESFAHHAYFFDEPIPKRVYTGVRRGSVDHRAPISFSFTPLGRYAPWMFVDLYSKADQKTIGVWTASIFDNIFLSKEAIEEFATDPTISDVEKEARLYGRFLHLVDRIYPIFNEDVHVIPDLRPDPDWTSAHVIDPHTVRPWAMAWFTVTPRGDLIWFREWPSEEFTKLRRDTRTPQDYAALIRRIEDIEPSGLRFIDPNYGRRTDVVRGTYVPSVCDVLSQYGLHYSGQLPDDLEYGETRVRGLLAYDLKREISATNRPRMYFCKSCRNIINAMNFYVASNRSAEDDFPDEKKRDPTYQDFADVVRYGAVSNAADMAAGDSMLFETLGANHEDSVSRSYDDGLSGLW